MVNDRAEGLPYRLQSPTPTVTTNRHISSSRSREGVLTGIEWNNPAPTLTLDARTCTYTTLKSSRCLAAIELEELVPVGEAKVSLLDLKQ